MVAGEQNCDSFGLSEMVIHATEELHLCLWDQIMEDHELTSAQDTVSEFPMVDLDVWHN